MLSRMKTSRLIALAVAGALSAGAVLAQHHGHASSPPGESATRFGFLVRGAFRDMVRKRDFEPKAALSDVMLAGATDGVGALSGLRGEVTLVGGRLVVSCGSKATCATPDTEKATLLASARVTAWSPGVTLPRDMEGAELGEFIEARAREHGLSLGEPFPLRIVGPIAGAHVHVNAAPNPRFAGHGGSEPMAIKDEERAARLDGEVVGVRVPLSLRGVATHPNEAFHFHWVDAQRSRTGHLDGFKAMAGSILLLPRE
jgi:alpha-acetolactate decarboxylase